MAGPTLTIGVTCYNDERFVRDCLESIAAQTYPDIEVIVVDDVSTDSTLDIVGEFLERYPDRFRVIRHEVNSGSLLQGRLDVIEAATGEFVHHIDADDALEPRFAERILNLFARDPSLDWVSPSVNVIDENGRVTAKWDYPAAGFTSHVPTALLRGYQTASVAVPMKGVFKMEFLRRNGLAWYELPHTAQGEDAFTCVKYLECNPKIAILSDALLRYRIHGRNMSAKPIERAKMVIDLKTYYIEHFSEMVYIPHPEFWRLEYGSGRYMAFKHALLAQDFLRAKREFKVPDVFAGPGPQDLDESKALFDEPIRAHALKSLEFGDYYEREVREVLAAIGE